MKLLLYILETLLELYMPLIEQIEFATLFLTPTLIVTGILCQNGEIFGYGIIFLCLQWLARVTILINRK